MKRSRAFELSPEFEEYQKYIIRHPNYQGQPNMLGANGEITWVRVGDKARAQWWDDLKVKLSLPDRASVARQIHPKELGNLKPCQVCGRKMSIRSIYPNANATKALTQLFPQLKIEHFKQDIFEICKAVSAANHTDSLEQIAKIFGITYTGFTAQQLGEEIVNSSKKLSPGAMSNAPDRLDGFHTLNACCRGTADTGRHRDNMVRYGTDRRAFENWADGNWSAANRLMGEYKKIKSDVLCPGCGEKRQMTADHIGPISLGFSHRMEFQPLCKKCNSSKNNRFTWADVKKLLLSEDSGIQVVSWHSRFIWDKLKVSITDDNKAKVAADLMRRNLHHVLVMLATIAQAGHTSFLERYLNPSYANFDYVFSDFDPETGTFRVIEKTVDSLNSRSKAKRYLRISFESLEAYKDKKNRKNSIWKDAECDEILNLVIESLDNGSERNAEEEISRLLQRLADLAYLEFK
jgi:Alw26I/Eco31I/Esp3I family type II restriction endonuclease